MTPSETLQSLAASLERRGVKTKVIEDVIWVGDGPSAPPAMIWQVGHENPSFCFFLLDLIEKGGEKEPSLGPTHRSGAYQCLIWPAVGVQDAIEGHGKTRTDAVVAALVALDEVKA